MVFANDPPELFQGRAGVVVGPDTPNNLATLFISDAYDVGLTGGPDDVIRVEVGVTGIEPLVGTQSGHGVDVHPVAAAVTHVGVAKQNVTGFLAPVEFVEVLIQHPFPDDLSCPIDLDKGVIK